MNYTKNIGNLGEDIAKKYLLNNGYIFITRNFKSKHREIDLIFKKKQQIVFIEVKTRIKTSESLTETPLSSLQVKNLKLAITDYSINNRINLDDIRLDLITILVDAKTHLNYLTHYKDII